MSSTTPAATAWLCIDDCAAVADSDETFSGIPLTVLEHFSWTPAESEAAQFRRNNNRRGRRKSKQQQQHQQQIQVTSPVSTVSQPSDRCIYFNHQFIVYICIEIS